MNFKIPVCLSALILTHSASVGAAEPNLFDFDAITDNYQSNLSTTPQQPMQPSKKSVTQHFDVYGDFLYWQPLVSNAYWGEKLSNNSTNIQQFRFAFNWDSGFRIGAQFNASWENISVDANWTRFHTSSTNTQSNIAVFSNINTPNFDLYALPGADYSYGDPWQIQATFNLQFDQGDFTFKKPLNFSKNFTLSPFGGLRGIVVDYTLNSVRNSIKYGGGSTTPLGPFNTSVLNVKDKMKSIGLLGGLNGNLMLGAGFSLYFGGDFFVGYGTDQASNNSLALFQGIASNSTSLTQQTVGSIKTMFDLSTGLTWNRNFANDRANLFFGAGYEFHALNNAPLFLYSGANEAMKTTAFQGLTIRGALGF
jgi:hypothetical protein